VNIGLAWRILTHDKGRSALAISGIFMAILLVFVELGLFVAVPQGGMLFYDHMRFDLLICSSEYEYQAQPHAFPRSRLERVLASPVVAQASPVYFAGAKWQSPQGGERIDVFVLAFEPTAKIFDVADIDRQLGVLEKPDTILVDSATRPMFGPLTTGRLVDIADRAVTIGGVYTLGTGFLGLGVVLVSTDNFARLFPHRGLDQVNLGLIRLKPGIDPDQAASELRQGLAADTRIFTRAELAAHEVEYWTSRTSVGLIFGSGLLVSVVVGIMILYLTLATQITRRLPQFATLKAMGYADRSLTLIVIAMAFALVAAAFVPATAAVLGIYSLIRDKTLLPVVMTQERLVAVFALVLVMAAVSALLSIRSLRRADPADLF